MTRGLTETVCNLLLNGNLLCIMYMCVHVHVRILNIRVTTNANTLSQPLHVHVHVCDNILRCGTFNVHMYVYGTWKYTSLKTTCTL